MGEQYADEMGGGLTQPSLTDVVNVREHDSGKDDPRIQPTVVDTDDFMGAFEEGAEPTTPWDSPSPTPYTGEDARRDMGAYASSSFRNNQHVSNVAGYGRAMTVALNGTMPPLKIVGQDWARKRAVLTINAGAVIYVSYGDSPSQQRGMAVAQVVPGPHHILAPGFEPGELIVEHADSIWIHTNTEVLPDTPVYVSYTVERYEK